MSDISNLLVFHSLDELKAGVSSHPAVRALPPDTGTVNPVFKVAVAKEGIILFYDAARHFLPAPQRRVYVEAPFFDEKGSHFMAKPPFDAVTESMRRKWEVGVPYVPLEIEVDDRRSFLNRPYAVGLCSEGVFGGAWQHYHTKANGAAGKAGKVMVCHLEVFRDFRGRGLGYHLLQAITAQVAKMNKGIMFEWDDDVLHRHSAKFFAAQGFEVKYSPVSKSYSAVKMFKGPASP